MKIEKNEKIKIEEGFLELSDFQELQTAFFGNPSAAGTLAWVFVDGMSYGLNSLDQIDEPNQKEKRKTEKEAFQFCHVFYEGFKSSSNFDVILPILNKIHDKTGITALFRIKANLLPRAPNIVEYAYHVDIGTLVESPERLKEWTTSIFYVNGNNGYTKFEDGTKVASVANRLITFPANMRHTGTTCTNQKRRMVINFDYYT